MTVFTTLCSYFRTVLITNTKELNHHHHNCSRSPNHQPQKKSPITKNISPPPFNVIQNIMLILPQF